MKAELICDEPRHSSFLRIFLPVPVRWVLQIEKFPQECVQNVITEFVVFSGDLCHILHSEQSFLSWFKDNFWLSDVLLRTQVDCKNVRRKHGVFFQCGEANCQCVVCVQAWIGFGVFGDMLGMSAGTGEMSNQGATTPINNTVTGLIESPKWIVSWNWRRSWRRNRNHRETAEHSITTPGSGKHRQHKQSVRMVQT